MTIATWYSVGPWLSCHSVALALVYIPDSDELTAVHRATQTVSGAEDAMNTSLGVCPPRRRYSMALLSSYFLM